MRISTFTRLVEDKIIAAAKSSAPHAKRYALSAKQHAAVAASATKQYAAKAAYATADGCIRVASKLEG